MYFSAFHLFIYFFEPPSMPYFHSAMLCINMLQTRDERTKIFSTRNPVQYFKMKIQSDLEKTKAKLRVRGPILVQK